MASRKKVDGKPGSTVGLQMIGGAAAGAAAGALAGPVGAAVGAVVGSIAGASAEMIVTSPAVRKRISAAKKSMTKSIKKSGVSMPSSKSAGHASPSGATNNANRKRAVKTSSRKKRGNRKK